MDEWKKAATMSDRLREAMANANKTQSDLAAETGLNKSTISRYLSGDVEPKLKAVMALSRALDVDYQWLYGYDTEKTRSEAQKKNDKLVKLIALMRRDEELLDMADTLSHLSPEKRASIKQLLNVLDQE